MRVIYRVETTDWHKSGAVATIQANLNVKVFVICASKLLVYLTICEHCTTLFKLNNSTVILLNDTDHENRKCELDCSCKMTTQGLFESCQLHELVQVVLLPLINGWLGSEHPAGVGVAPAVEALAARAAHWWALVGIWLALVVCWLSWVLEVVFLKKRIFRIFDFSKN